MGLATCFSRPLFHAPIKVDLHGAAVGIAPPPHLWNWADLCRASELKRPRIATKIPPTIPLNVNASANDLLGDKEIISVDALWKGVVVLEAGDYLGE